MARRNHSDNSYIEKIVMKILSRYLKYDVITNADKFGFKFSNAQNINSLINNVMKNLI